MEQTQGNPVRKVYLTACWGNGDASSDTVITEAKWLKIEEGLRFSKGAYAWYEGKRYHVTWSFNQREEGSFSIDGDDGRQCIVEAPLSEIHVSEH